MKNKLAIRGVIVPSSYDGAWADDYIKRGMFIPESRVRTMLEAFDKKNGIELYINSPGGSVFAGNEIINALNAWAKESGQEVEITIGAMAASMAAVMAISVNSAKVVAHKNSKIMFHGAWTETIGGADAHKDEAGLLEKINNDIKAILVSRFQLSPEQINEWFLEGRVGWLSAEDAKKAGIVSEILDAEDKAQKINKTASAMLSERGLKIAAILESEIIEEEATTEGKTHEGGTEAGSTGGQGIAGIAAAEGAPTAQAGTEAGPAVAEVPGASEELASHDVINLSTRLISMEKERRDWQARYDKLNIDLKKKQTDFEAIRSGLQKEIAERDSRISGLESRLSRMTLDALALDSDPVVQTWPDALRACNDDYLAARKKYPVVFDQHVKAEQNRKKAKR